MDPIVVDICKLGFQFEPSKRPTMAEICDMFKGREKTAAGPEPLQASSSHQTVEEPSETVKQE
jgi:hypothetical protein